jgi:hypothetical protein
MVCLLWYDLCCSMSSFYLLIRIEFPMTGQVSEGRSPSESLGWFFIITYFYIHDI